MLKIMVKIQSNVFRNTRSKLAKLTQPLSYLRKRRDWISPSSLHNYMVNDTLVDWLKLYNTRKHISYSKSTENTESFKTFICNKGNEFEENVVDYIHKNLHPVQYVSDSITCESVNQTIEYIKQGVPIIHSAPLKNKYNNTHGVADLLVRSDYLERICPNADLYLTEKDRTKKAKNLSGNYHYVVIDIKFSTLHLRADGIHIQNNDRYPAYKAQLWVYNQALSYIQGYNPPYAFILGRRSHFTRNKKTVYITDTFTRLGKVDFTGVDKPYVEKSKTAIKWCREVREKGNTWSINPPSRMELYPNMCKDSGYWNAVKKDLALKNGDITMLWNCGVKHRENAIKQGVYSWRDERCNADVLGFKHDSTRKNAVDAIIDINRSNTHLIRPMCIKSDYGYWRDTGNEIFVDFETMFDVFSNEIPTQGHTNQIFMIGAGWVDDNNVWQYKDFTCETLGIDGERKIITDFLQFLREMNYPKIWYWSAENSFWNQACKRHNINVKLENSYDLAVLFQTEPIVIKNCFNYGLKNIASSMREHGMISEDIHSDCKNGTMATIKAYDVYKYGSCHNKCPIMDDIKSYNNFDCKVMWDILTYLRDNM